MKIQQPKLPWKLATAIGIVAVLIWIAFGVVVTSGICDWPTRGQFGDMFGALSCLFSLLAFGGVLYTIIESREEKKRESLRTAYESVLVAIEHQIEAAKSSGADLVAIGDLYAKQRYYSELLEEMITERKAGPLLTDAAIVAAFATIPWFNSDELKKEVNTIRARLRNWMITDPEQLTALVQNLEIRSILTKAYVSELKRDSAQPFDPHALAVWGGLLFRQGTSSSVVKHFHNSLKLSNEWKEKNPIG